MNKPLRLGVVGLTHDHVWGNLEAIRQLDGIELVAVADGHQPLLDRVQNEYGCATYLNHEEMGDKKRLDAVFICADNAGGAELAVWAAERGYQVMVEKPMAATLDGAERMVAAANRAGVRLMINWPVAWRPQVQAALDRAMRSEVGEIWQLTHRAAHGGVHVECSPYFREWIVRKELNGGGALLDLCCYGVNLAQVLLGRPERVMAVTGNLLQRELSVEDNAMVVMSYPHAIATAEGAWGQVGKPFTGYLATIWGSKGALILGPGRGGKLWKTTADQPDCVEIELSQPEPHMTSGPAHFAWALSTGSEFHPLCRAATCRDTQEVLQAAVISSETRQEVRLPLAAGK